MQLEEQTQTQQEVVYPREAADLADSDLAHGAQAPLVLENRSLDVE
jgi:hypothetical protein